jgi:hypothetical protein
MPFQFLEMKNLHVLVLKSGKLDYSVMRPQGKVIFKVSDRFN